MKLGRLMVIPLLAALCLVLGSCFEAADMLTLIKLNADGSAEMMFVAGGLTYEKEGTPVSREQVLAEIESTCADMRKESTDERTLVRCEAKLPADALGPWFHALADDGRINGNYVLRYRQALKLFEEMAMRDQNNQPIQLRYTMDSVSIDLRVYAERAAGKESGLIAIQSPWPIVSTNADMLIPQANLALWDSRKLISQGKGLTLELLSAKPAPTK